LKAGLRHNAVLDCKYASSSKVDDDASLKFVRPPTSIDVHEIIADETSA